MTDKPHDAGEAISEEFIREASAHACAPNLAALPEAAPPPSEKAEGVQSVVVDAAQKKPETEQKRDDGAPTHAVSDGAGRLPPALETYLPSTLPQASALVPLDENPAEAQAPAAQPQRTTSSDTRTTRRMPPSFSEVWQQAYGSPEPDRRIKFAAAAAVAVALGVFFIVDALIPTQLSEWEVEKMLAAELASQAAETPDWFADLQEAKKRPSLWEPLRAVAQRPDAQPLPASRPPDVKARSPGAWAAKQKLNTKPQPALSKAPEQDDDANVDPLYAQLYGSPKRVRASSSRTAAIPSTKRASEKRTMNVRGVEIPARLLDEVNSNPSGAPVKAVTTSPIAVGDIEMPQATELEGVVSGGSDTRVYIEFDLARLPDGRSFAIEALARDRSKGGLGVPGHKRFDARAVESVGVSTIGRVVSTAGRVLGGRMGEIAGAGVEGAAESTSEKSQRLSRDEVSVTASQGTPFKVYIKAIASSDAVRG